MTSDCKYQTAPKTLCSMGASIAYYMAYVRVCVVVVVAVGVVCVCVCVCGYWAGKCVRDGQN